MPARLLSTCGILAISLLCLSNAARAQEGADAAKGGQEKQAEPQTPAQSNDRLLWALPNFLTVENGVHVPPLTAREKFHQTFRSSFDYVDYGWYAFQAGASQAGHSGAGYATGVAGYAERYATDFADGTIENVVTSAVLPTLLQQDPRYYQLGKGGAWHRAGYSISRTVVTRSDAGRTQVNYSEIFGSLVTAGLSTSYRPAGSRHVANMMSAWETLVAYDTAQTVLKEFWPDIRRRVHKS